MMTGLADGPVAVADGPVAVAEGPVANRRAQCAAVAYALVVAAILAHFMLGLPIQVSDSFGNMLHLSRPLPEMLASESTQAGFMRPLAWAQGKILYDLAGGNYTAWFRWAHALQVVPLVLLYLVLVRPRTWRDTALLPLGLAVLVGLHTFIGTVREAFPINFFLTTMWFCFAAAAIALARPRWWNDVLAGLLFVVAVLTVETGLLVWVIFIAAAIVGAKGVSRIGLSALVLLLAAYFLFRFVVLDVGAPDLFERSSGYGFRVLERRELWALFNENPLPFYLYNIAASALTVLFTEPMSGAYYTTSAFLRGELTNAMVVNLVSSLGICALLAAFAWHRRRDWIARRFDRDDRLVLLFGAVLAANATISYPYAKDVVMSPAGGFLAVAALVAGRRLLAALPARVPMLATAALVIAAVAVGSAWSLRVLSVHGVLRRGAFIERLDWAYIESDIADGSVDAPGPNAAPMAKRLRHEALVLWPAPPSLVMPFQRFIAQ